jgi:hypothetical protein
MKRNRKKATTSPGIVREASLAATAIRAKQSADARKTSLGSWRGVTAGSCHSADGASPSMGQSAASLPGTNRIVIR